MNKRESFLLALMEESTITGACKKAGIGRTRAYQFLNDDEFKRDYEQLKYKTLEKITSYLQGKLAECSNTLMDIIRSEEASSQVKINACQTIFKACFNLTEISDILPRLQAMEDMEKRLDKLERTKLNSFGGA